MADIDRSLADVKAKMRKFQEEQENQLLDLRNKHQNMINQVISEAQQGAIGHRETLERKYREAYNDIERQLKLKFEGTLKQVEGELDSLRSKMNTQMEAAQHQLDENTKLVEAYGQGRKEALERERCESCEIMKGAESDLEQLSGNCFVGILYRDILFEYQKMYRNIEYYFDNKFYQTVVALSISLSRECTVKNYETSNYMKKYARRILALRRAVEKYQLFLEDNYKKADLYGDAICKKHKLSKTKMDESFIDYWSNGMYSLRISRLEQAISFLEEHGIEVCEKYDENTTLERIREVLESGERLKGKLIEYINTGDIIVYDMEKTIRDEISTLENEQRIYEKTIKRYNDRLNIEKWIDKKLQEYQYARIKDEKNFVADYLDQRIGMSLRYENQEGLELEICVISVKNNYKKDIENQIVIVVDYDELGITAEQYIQDRKSILQEIPLLKSYVIETCGDIHASADTKYADMQRILYDKCNPYGRM